MPIYEFYCPDNNRIYSFFARSAAERERIPACPDNPSFRMVKMLSPFAIGKPDQTSGSPNSQDPGHPDLPGGDTAPGDDDPRMIAAMAEMERAMDGISDENPDPKTLGRLMRRMAELTGEPMQGGMEEMVRKLEEGQDPERLEEELSGLMDDAPIESHAPSGPKRPPTRDPKLYDYN